MLLAEHVTVSFRGDRINEGFHDVHGCLLKNLRDSLRGIDRSVDAQRDRAQAKLYTDLDDLGVSLEDLRYDVQSLPSYGMAECMKRWPKVDL